MNTARPARRPTDPGGLQPAPAPAPLPEAPFPLVRRIRRGAPTQMGIAVPPKDPRQEKGFTSW